MPKTTPNFNAVLAETERADPKLSGAKRNWLSFDSVFISFCCSFSIGFLIFAYCVSLIDPEYFNRRVLATMPPPQSEAAARVARAAAADLIVGSVMPAPRIVRTKEPVPADYQIITVFDREAILATQDELMRVKVGSVAPGLGEILAIDETGKGLVIRTAEATLRSDAN